ncbi:ROBO2 [Lepeophtheirus salmonis]|uniref:ROBO2 n=1 Tax=Lepeophtheirus salmonis TaxID=72036 RepID=A0A7R8HD07_LEPSM|nr:ROBO2 [Lepeophtheirus salmonis]CAF3017111.1 ROBO2 [Lepeophtheirus salmonis]
MSQWHPQCNKYDPSRLTKFSGDNTAFLYSLKHLYQGLIPTLANHSGYSILRDKFRGEPVDSDVILGQTAELICIPPKGNPSPTVFWKKNGQILDLETEEERLYIKDEGTLVIPDSIPGDEGSYQCIAKNIAGTKATQRIHLEVGIVPSITKAPENASIASGKEIRLVCVAEGKPKPMISWSKSAGSLPLSRSRIEGGLLIIKNAITTDEDVYRCMAENSAGMDTATAAIRIHSPPIFLVKPSNQKIAVGAPASLDCIAAGNPTPVLFWMKEGATGIFLPGHQYEAGLHVTPEGTLKLQDISLSDAGYYSCVSVSPSGSTLSRAQISVSKESDKPPPIIVLGPINQTLPLGSRVSLPCQSSAQDTIIWLKDGVPLSSKSHQNLYINKENTLRIEGLSLSDSGLYTCQARSVSGQSVWSSSLVVSEGGGLIDFKPMPDLSQFPGSPSKPSLANATSHSITVTWSKPHRVGGSPLKGYQLDYYTLASPLHWTTVYNVHSEFHTIDDLDPETTLWVLVRALNGYGLSPPSPVSKSLKTLAPDPNSRTGMDPWSIRSKLGGRIMILIGAISVGSRKIKLEWELLISGEFVEGYHIQIRGSKEPHYDSVTISGGGTRSHTLSDLRPNTKYFIFILPFNNRIKGRPSNLKVVSTKEDVPSSSPDRIKIRLVNVSTGLIQWHTPPSRDLNGDLSGFKVLIFVNSSLESNYTLEPDVNSFLITELSSDFETAYGAKVAAYNRQGVGPFSPMVSININPMSGDIHGVHRNELSEFFSPEEANPHGFDIVLQEVWFVSFVSVMTLVLVIAFGAVICIRRRKGELKNMGHYNVPIHKVDDISHVNFGNRDHLWLDSNWKSSETNGKGKHIFINKLTNFTQNATNNSTNTMRSNSNRMDKDGDYAEVDTPKSTDTHQKDLVSKGDGPYATTSLVSDPPSSINLKNGSISSKPSPNSSLARQELEMSSLDSNKGISSKKSGSSSSLLASSHANHILNKSSMYQKAPSSTSSSGDSMSKMPPFLMSNRQDMELFSSPLPHSKGSFHSNSSTPKCLSYNRAGSYGSFGNRQGASSSFGPPLHMDGYGHSHYSVPGIFYHPSLHPDPYGKAVYEGSGEETYESASICHYGIHPGDEEDGNCTSGYFEGDEFPSNSNILSSQKDSGLNLNFWDSYISDGHRSLHKDKTSFYEGSKSEDLSEKKVDSTASALNGATPEIKLKRTPSN